MSKVRLCHYNIYKVKVNNWLGNGCTGYDIGHRLWRHPLPEGTLYGPGSKGLCSHSRSVRLHRCIYAEEEVLEEGRGDKKATAITLAQGTMSFLPNPSYSEGSHDPSQPLQGNTGRMKPRAKKFAWAIALSVVLGVIGEWLQISIPYIHVSSFENLFRAYF
jgi:hypothetical protein